ncbi:hypothetical protein HKCCE3408_19325 [Rhodobacterales bacterium HKCCE3408]|nr:hypothetical protein [Rhodobacterales bacterium HKCCE3408]
MTRTEIDTALQSAHAAGDRAGLSRLYALAADAVALPAETAFLLTQAYVFALDAGLPEATALKGRLQEMGAER